MTAILAVGCERGVPGRRIEVDRIEGRMAVVVDPQTGGAANTPVTALPLGIREGDVLVDGAVDPPAGEALRDEIAKARAALPRGTLELEPARSDSGRTPADPGTSPLRRARRLTVRREP